MAENAHDDAEQKVQKALVYDFARVLGEKIAARQLLPIINGEKDANTNSKDAIAEC
jgi:hypothetical protein